MFDEEVPPSFLRFVGHVCGVIAVAMAAFSAWGIWSLVNAAINGHLPAFGVILVLIPIGISALFFRWAGVLTGYWSAHGRLSVPAGVYAGFGVLCAALAVFGMYSLIVPPPMPIGPLLLNALGTIGGGAIAYWCYVLLKTRRK